LSPDAQKLLLCLAPFSGFIDRTDLPRYAEQLRQLEPFAEYRFEQFDGAIQEAIDWGLLSPINADNPHLLTIQPVFPYFLKTKLNQLDGATREALSEGFKNHYRGLARSYNQLMNSDEPQERQKGILFCQWEYENLYNALQICLKKQESFNIYSCLDNYLDLISDTQNRLKLSEFVCKILEVYPLESITSEIGFEIAEAYLRLGNCCSKTQDYSSARSTYLKLLESLQNLEALPNNQRQLAIATTYHQLGIVAQELRDFKKARTNYKKALQTKIDFNDRYAQADTYHNLGIVAQELRDFKKARTNYKKALQIKIDFNDRYAQATTYHQLGSVAQRLHDFEEARTNYKKALQIKIDFNDRYAQADTYHNLGGVAQELRDFEEARTNYKKALQIKIDFNNRYAQAGTYGQIGLLAEAEGNQAEAKICLQKALEIFLEFGDECRAAIVQQHLDRLSS